MDKFFRTTNEGSQWYWVINSNYSQDYTLYVPYSFDEENHIEVDEIVVGKRHVCVMCLNGLNDTQRSMLKLPRYYLCSKAISVHMIKKGGRVLFEGPLNKAETELHKLRDLENRMSDG